jgi:hypothetical protein
VSVIRLITVQVARAIDAVDAADRRCTAVSVNTDQRCYRHDRVSEFGRGQLYAVPAPYVGPNAYAVLCELHFDQIRRDDRKAAQARAAALAADTQDSLF